MTQLSLCSCISLFCFFFFSFHFVLLFCHHHRRRYGPIVRPRGRFVYPDRVKACSVTSWPTSPHPIPTRADGWIGVSEEDLIKKKKPLVPLPDARRVARWHWPTLDMLDIQPHSKKKNDRNRHLDVVAHPLSFRGLGLTNQPDGKRAAIFFFFFLVGCGIMPWLCLLDALKSPKRGLISREMGLLYERFTAC